jgi:hypothetical protein
VKIPRARLAAALTPILFGAVAAVLIGRAPQPGSGTRLDAATTPVPVTVSCSGRQLTRPAELVLACADGNAYLTGLHWSTWGSAAYGTGTWRVNGCTPDCAAGTFHSFPAVVMLWRPEPVAHHHGARYFSRITMLLPSTRCDQADGKRTCYPASYTGNMWGSTSGGLPLGS